MLCSEMLMEYISVYGYEYIRAIQHERIEATVPAEGAQKISAARLLQSDAVLGNADGIWPLARNQNIKQRYKI